MSEHWARDDISDRIDAGGGGFEVVIDWNAAFFIDLNADRVETQAFGERLAAYGYEDLICFKL